MGYKELIMNSKEEWSNNLKSEEDLVFNEDEETGDETDSGNEDENGLDVDYDSYDDYEE